MPHSSIDSDPGRNRLCHSRRSFCVPFGEKRVGDLLLVAVDAGTRPILWAEL